MRKSPIKLKRADFDGRTYMGKPLGSIPAWVSANFATFKDGKYLHVYHLHTSSTVNIMVGKTLNECKANVRIIEEKFDFSSSKIDEIISNNGFDDRHKLWAAMIEAMRDV